MNNASGDDAAPVDENTPVLNVVRLFIQSQRRIPRLADGRHFRTSLQST
jgi:hypothetical protein